MMVQHDDDGDQEEQDAVDSACLAVMGGDEAWLRDLHARGFKFDQKDAAGLTPALLAASSGQAACLRILQELQGPSALEVRKADGRGVMHLAASEGHVDCLQVLGELGVPMNEQDDLGWTPAHASAANGHVDCLEILKRFDVSLTAQTMDGWTPAHCAAFAGSVASLQALNELGVFLDVKDKEGEVPAHKAAAAGGGRPNTSSCSSGDGPGGMLACAAQAGSTYG
eukprot:TRINITY_DN20154_c0_g1_i1.p1 TRINITY_DN20154_c0_g1~~TRINITY_DN20154_c0_g1_i1.p1  ORF type:complete len:225 (-),score=74.21 TRINITY_DN20154_c0_g1_i1:89-763(-)